MLKTQSAGGIVLNQKGQVLVVSQHGTSWSLPKGHIDPGEDPLTAAKREITEESGVTKLTLIKEFGSYGRYKIGKFGEDDQSEHKTIHMYLFTTPEMDLKPIDPHNPEARWLDKEKVVDLLSHREDKKFFLSIMTDLRLPA